MNDLIKFTNDLPDQNLNCIVSDEGGEFKGEFDLRCKEEEIKHRVIIADKQTDHNALAPLNSMCRYIR